MTPRSITFFCLFLLLGVSYKAQSQFGFSHEIGAIVGPVAFQSDYGERHDLSTNAGNSGFGIGIIHYMNFSYASDCNCYAPETYFNDHFKIRSELSYSKAKLNHFGQWVEGKPSDGKDKLKAMYGSSSLTNIGMQLEFYPFSIRDFAGTIESWAPFVSLGAQYSVYNAKADSSLGKGPLGIPDTTFDKYLTPSDGRPYGFSSESNSIFSIVTSVGTRYKLSTLSDFIVDLRVQYYFSDWVDGLNPNPELFKENKANDWNVWFNVGYIYYLQ